MSIYQSLHRSKILHRISCIEFIFTLNYGCQGRELLQEQHLKVCSPSVHDYVLLNFAKLVEGKGGCTPNDLHISKNVTAGRCSLNKTY